MTIHDLEQAYCQACGFIQANSQVNHQAKAL